MERSRNFYKTIRLGYILISVLIGCKSWAYGPKEGVEAFESITFFIRFIYAINFEHLLSTVVVQLPCNEQVVGPNPT